MIYRMVKCSVDECEELALINTMDIVCSEHLFSDLNEPENENQEEENNEEGDDGK